MFKKLLNVRGKNAATTEHVSPDTSTCAEMITVFDSYGRELKISRKEWLTKMLLPNIETARNDPDKLYSHIISALNDGFFREIVEATSRLIDIDQNAERSHIVRGIVLMNIGELDAAEGAFRTGMLKAGETGTLLTNLAKVFTARGNSITAEEILWKAIQRDPNQENGLTWWLSIQQERGGQAEYLRALQQTVTLPGSWLPQLWLARHHLGQKEIEQAKALYQNVLQTGLYDNTALTMISGDLGNYGQVALIPELIGAVFNPDRHDPRSGLNLLQAYLTLRQWQEGQALLNRMYALNLAPFKQHLDQFSAKFEEICHAETPPTPMEDINEAKVETVSVDRPIWMYGLHEPNWLFADKAADAPHVAILSFGKIQIGTEQSETQREDKLGRLTRAIPLYFAEAIHYWTTLKGSTLIPVIHGSGPIVFGAGGDDTELFNALGEDVRYLVTGEIGNTDDQWTICIRLWDRASRQNLLTESMTTTPGSLADTILILEQKLLNQLGGASEKPLDDFYVRPSSDAMQPYLSQLGQSFMLTLIANGLVPKESMWGERNMLEWPLQMALQYPGAAIPKVMYLSGLAKAAAYQSSLLMEFQSRTLDLLRSMHTDKSPVAQLEPLVWKIFNIEEKLKTLSSTSASANDTYNRWQQRILTPAE